MLLRIAASRSLHARSWRFSDDLHLHPWACHAIRGLRLIQPGNPAAAHERTSGCFCALRHREVCLHVRGASLTIYILIRGRAMPSAGYLLSNHSIRQRPTERTRSRIRPTDGKADPRMKTQALPQRVGGDRPGAASPTPATTAHRASLSVLFALVIQHSAFDIRHSCLPPADCRLTPPRARPNDR